MLTKADKPALNVLEDNINTEVYDTIHQFREQVFEKLNLVEDQNKKMKIFVETFEKAVYKKT